MVSKSGGDAACVLQYNLQEMTAFVWNVRMEAPASLTMGTLWASCKQTSKRQVKLKEKANERARVKARANAMAAKARIEAEMRARKKAEENAKKRAKDAAEKKRRNDTAEQARRRARQRRGEYKKPLTPPVEHNPYKNALRFFGFTTKPTPDIIKKRYRNIPL